MFFFSFALDIEKVANKHFALWLSLGNNGNFSLAIGGRGTNWGLEIGGINDGDYSSEELLDYPVPHNDYTNLGTHKIDGTYGIDILYYPLNWSNISIGGSIGLYFYEEAEVAESNVTGWLYKQHSEVNIEPALGVHVDWFLPKRFMIGLTLHSIRGISVRLGYGY